MERAPADHALGFVTRFFAQLAASGVTHAVLSPGSRSTPLSLGAHAAGLDTRVSIDERSGGFYALGMAKATRRPVVLACTSGTAAANYLPAVVEAAHSGVPLLVLTADRPPELRGWGAGQTIDQQRLFGSNTEWFFDAPVASEAPTELASRLAARCVIEAAAGPVHVNFPFRKPLVGEAMPILDDLQRVVTTTSDAPRPSSAEVEHLVGIAAQRQRGLVVAGPGDLGTDDVAGVAKFAQLAQWPIIAEPTSQLRCGPHLADNLVVATADLLLRDRRFAADVVPEAVLVVGGAPTSKSIRTWLADHRPRHVIASTAGRDVADPFLLSTALTGVATTQLAAAAASRMEETPPDTAWPKTWSDADRSALAVIEAELGGGSLDEPRSVRAVADSIPPQTAVYVSNSLPVRDLDTVWPPTAQPRRFYAHRGGRWHRRAYLRGRRCGRRRCGAGRAPYGGSRLPA